VVECAGLEIRYTVPPYRGFESLLLRQKCLVNQSLGDAKKPGQSGLFSCPHRSDVTADVRGFRDQQARPVHPSAPRLLSGSIPANQCAASSSSPIPSTSTPDAPQAAATGLWWQFGQDGAQQLGVQQRQQRGGCVGGGVGVHAPNVPGRPLALYPSQGGCRQTSARADLHRICSHMHSICTTGTRQPVDSAGRRSGERHAVKPARGLPLWGDVAHCFRAPRLLHRMCGSFL
jgi:hypothetical protein